MTVTSTCALLNSGNRQDYLVCYCSASRMTLLWQEVWDSFLEWRQLLEQTGKWRNRTSLEWAYDLLIYDLLIYGVICAVGCLDFESAHLTGSSTSCGLLTWCTVKIKSFLFNKQERCCYCHVAIIEMKLKLLLSEVYSSQSVIYNTDIHAYLVCHK